MNFFQSLNLITSLFVFIFWLLYYDCAAIELKLATTYTFFIYYYKPKKPRKIKIIDCVKYKRYKSYMILDQKQFNLLDMEI
jgi:hypothetical protein